YYDFQYETVIPTYPNDPTSEAELQDFLCKRVESILESLENIQNQAQENVKKAQNKQKAYYDQKRIETYQISDKVMLHETS
ncbi:12436_t:CDS:2, partial [Gigaspora margarita]